jgi:anti-sigma regulatory factor (Ser/Thr protein kinase)
VPTIAAEQLAAEPLSVRAARRTVTLAMVNVLPPRDLDELLLCTSEVVTNAVEHGATPIELVVDRAEDRVRVEVRDASPLPPRSGLDPGPMELRGRGLLIVDRCADRWGVELLGDGGKAVWFELDLQRHEENEVAPPR